MLSINDSVKNSMIINSHPKSYEVRFDKLSNNFNDNDLILIDANVKKLYNITHDNMIVIEATEENKSINTVLMICDKMINNGFNKGNRLIVIGGGILQDIGAFVSKIFKRGIPWTFYPTTLLSQCDSCIGGKTALNYNSYKNQLALFSAPDDVIIDTNFLNTLSDSEILSGYGEITKLFLIGGDYYTRLLTSDLDLKELIYHALSIKRSIIQMDEFENMERKSLNYGHSFGHAIESITNYNIPHGEAVLLGIEVINKLFNDNPVISDIVYKFTSLNKLKGIDVEGLILNLKNDKKVLNDVITLIRVTEPGRTIFTEINLDENLKKKLYEIFAN